MAWENLRHSHGIMHCYCWYKEHCNQFISNHNIKPSYRTHSRDITHCLHCHCSVCSDSMVNASKLTGILHGLLYTNGTCIHQLSVQILLSVLFYSIWYFCSSLLCAACFVCLVIDPVHYCCVSLFVNSAILLYDAPCAITFVRLIMSLCVMHVLFALVAIFI